MKSKALEETLEFNLCGFYEEFVSRGGINSIPL